MPVATEYVDFYADMHKIRKKCVYHRKYHIKNNIKLSMSGLQRLQTKNVETKMIIFKVIDTFGILEDERE